MRSVVNDFLIFLIWVFGPTICIVLIACLLSLTPLKPPKTRRGGWFIDKEDW